MKKGKIITIILILILLAGMSLLLYPTISNYWNSLHASRVVARYNEKVAQLTEVDYTEALQAAKDYNTDLAKGLQSRTLTDNQRKKYNSILDICDNGVMGYIEIPCIDVSIPIYHGTEEKVLQIAAGHLEWTSLPVGGESTHCVISGHRGLPSAKLFTNLDKLTEGDTFELKVLNEALTYEVDQILIVEPGETDPLAIEKGKDYCTLVTCTPYGVNTHRLLVRGVRIDPDDASEKIRVASNALQVETLVVAVIIAGPLLIFLLIWLSSRDKKTSRNNRNKKKLIDSIKERQK